MSEPDPGIIANIKVKHVDYNLPGDIVKVVFFVPRYCAVRKDGSPYFEEGYDYACQFIADYPVVIPPDAT